MEDILDLYEEAYNPKQPVICFDERPCQLLGEVSKPIPMKPGQPERRDYRYQRNGVCAPRTGRFSNHTVGGAMRFSRGLFSKNQAIIGVGLTFQLELWTTSLIPYLNGGF